MTGKEKLEMEKMLADEVKKLGVEGLGAPEITHRTKGVPILTIKVTMDPSGTYVCIDDALSKVFREKFFGKAASDAYVKDAALLIASDKRILSMVETASKLFVAECRRSAEGQL